MIRNRPFVIAGAQRSCSTSLAAALRTHREIEMPRGEVGSFESSRWESAHRWTVWAAHRSSDRGLIFGFKRPEVFHEAELGRRVSAALPGISGVVILRDPVERLLSAYFHYVEHGVLRIDRDFEYHLSAMLAASYAKLSPVERTIVGYSQYAAAATTLRAAFRGRVLFRFQEDLLRSTKRALCEIQDFIGVDPDQDMALGAKNAGNYSVRTSSARRLFGAVTYRLDADSGRIVPRPQLVRAVGRPLAAFRPGFGHPTNRPEVSPRLREMGQAKYGPDLRQLESILDRAVPSSWSIQAS